MGQMQRTNYPTAFNNSISSTSWLKNCAN
uniref:Uncharacterized protein n=1 Tax=Anguilla anguilla TaxID=7936 RepID=A0A0E9RJV8_ANGAN